MTKRATTATTKRHSATATGTERFHQRVAARFVDDFFRPLAGGLTASSIGIGTYLGECADADDASYTSAIRSALENGINLVDSSINYRCQRSERAVGHDRRP